jgi:uncharacterized membrane protein YadS
MNQHGFLYRFVVIFVVCALFFSLVLISFAAVGALPEWAQWTLYGAMVAFFLLAEAGNEYAVYRRKKHHDENH